MTSPDEAPQPSGPSLPRAEARARFGAPRPAVLVFAMLALVAGAYATVISGGFVWDDHALIEQQPMVKRLAAPQHYLLQKFLANPLEADIDAYYRPLTTFSFAVDYRLGGGRPLVFHLTNLLLHLLACLLVFLLARRLGANPVSSALAGAAFGVAPRLTESVAWISGRTDVLALVFTAAALLLAVRAEARRRTWWFAGVALLAGLLSKETAIAVLPVLFIWGLCRSDLIGRDRGTLRRAIPLGLAVAVYGGLRLAANLQSVGHASADPSALTWGERALTALEGLGRYLFMVLDPFQPRIRIGIPGIPDWTFVGLGLAASGLWITGMYWLHRRRASELLGLAGGAFIALALTLHLIPIAGQVVAADRYLYVPLAFLAVGVAVASTRGPPVWRRRGLLLGLPLVVSFALVTYGRAGLWLSEKHLWEAAVTHVAPEDGLPLGELGITYLKAYRVEEALALLKRRAQAEEARLRRRGIQFSTFELSNNAAVCERMLGHYTEAERILEASARRNPHKARLRYNLAMTYASSGDFGRARKLLQQEDGDGSLSSLSRTLLARIDKAELALRHAALLPNHTARVAVEATAWDGLGSLAKARAGWEEILREPTATPSQVRAASIFLATKGTREQALAALGRIQEIGDVDLAAVLGRRISERYE